MILNAFLTQAKKRTFLKARFGFLFFLFFNMLNLAMPIQAQNLKLVIGHYDCTSNSDCNENQYCNIDNHACVTFPETPEQACNAELCDLDEICSEVKRSDCADDEYFDSDIGSCQKKPENCRYILNGKCIECLQNAECNTNEVCNLTTYMCQACPADNPFPLGETCVSCVKDSDCPGSTETCDPATFTCQSCPTETPVRASTCISCFAKDATRPLWNGTECAACPTGTAWNTATSKCAKQITITWRNFKEVKTQTFLEGENINTYTPSFKGLTFDKWKDALNGKAISFPLKATKSQTFYAHYKVPSTSEERIVLRYGGGSVLGSENGAANATRSYNAYDGYVTYDFQVYLKTAWNNDGYNCTSKLGKFAYKVDNGTAKINSTHCSWLNLGAGTKIYIYPYEDTSKYHDVIWEVQLKATPRFKYPY